MILCTIFLQLLCLFMPKFLYIMPVLCHLRIKICQFYVISTKFWDESTVNQQTKKLNDIQKMSNDKHNFLNEKMNNLKFKKKNDSNSYLFWSQTLRRNTGLNFNKNIFAFWYRLKCNQICYTHYRDIQKILLCHPMFGKTISIKYAVT